MNHFAELFDLEQRFLNCGPRTLGKPQGVREDLVSVVAECARHRIVAGLVTSSSPVQLKTRRVGHHRPLGVYIDHFGNHWYKTSRVYGTWMWISLRNQSFIRGFLISLKTDSYASVRSFRLQDLLSQAPALRKATVNVEESTLSHQVQRAFGTKLRELVITGSNLRTILPDAFAGLTTHELIIRISGTLVSKFPDGLLRYLPDVRYLTLDLRHNQLTSMDPGVLAAMTKDGPVAYQTQHITVAQQPKRAIAYYALPSIRDHWVLRCMNRCPDQVVSLKRDIQCFSPQNLLVKSVGPKVLSAESRVQGTGEYFPPIQFHGKIVKVEISGGTIYRAFGEFLLAKTYCDLYGAQALGQRQAYF
ncbi:uncharacterized protein TNCV_824601 [Trichonephila clavipes]|nr:uncharacterized protein TNCV_824601 [Trichonephila clavipes]